MRANDFGKSAIICFAIAGLVAGCVFFPSAKDRALRRSPSFQEGYSDGCAAATTPSSDFREGPMRNNALYQSDQAYRAGWANGLQTCRTTGQGAQTAPGSNPIPEPLPSH